MFKLLTLLALCATFYVIEASSYGGDYDIKKNPNGYGSYDCPYGFKRYDLDYKSYSRFTFMVFGTKDKAACALKDTKAKCKKPNGNKKTWITYKYGYGEFHITKFDRFSRISSSSSSTTYKAYKNYRSSSSSRPSTSKSSTNGYGDSDSTSTSSVPQYFAVRAMYFYVRGVRSMTVELSGEISQRIDIGEKTLDYRKKTFICIKFETFPVYNAIWFEFYFNRKTKAKFWGLFLISCCEILKDTIVTIGK